MSWYFRIIEGMQRRWDSAVRGFWRWVLWLAASRLGIEDRIEVLDEDWWRVVRHRLRELRRSDLGVNFIRTLFMEDEWNAPDDQGRDYRDTDRDVRDPK